MLEHVVGYRVHHISNRHRRHDLEFVTGELHGAIPAVGEVLQQLGQIAPMCANQVQGRPNLTLLKVQPVDPGLITWKSLKADNGARRCDGILDTQ